MRATRLLLPIGLITSALGLAEGTTKGYQELTEGKRGTKLLRNVSSRDQGVRILPSSRGNALVRKRERSARGQKSSKKKSSEKADRGTQLPDSDEPTSGPLKAAPTPVPVLASASPVKSARTLPPNMKAEKACSEAVNGKGESKTSRPSECQKQQDQGADTRFPTTRPSIDPTLPTISPTPIPTAIPTISPTFSPTESPTNSPTIAPSTVPTTAAPTLAPAATTDRPSMGPVALIQTTTVVSIDIDLSSDPSFQNIVDVAALTCDQIRAQSAAVVEAAAPVIVVRDTSCSILRDSTADNILLEIGVTFEDSSMFIPAESEIAAVVCDAITGQNEEALLGLLVSLPSNNAFVDATSVQCSLSIDATEVPTGTPTKAPTSAVPTKRPTTLPTTAKTATPSSGPTKSPVTSQPTTAPVKRPTVGPTAGTLAPTFGVSTSLPTEAPSSKPTLQPTKAPTRRPSQAPVTPAPTEEQSSQPSQAPVTPAPTEEQSSQPSQAPVTPAPTEEQSSRPSEAPVTPTPTNGPTTSHPPTKTPTKSPSLSPVTPTPTIGLTTSRPTVSATSPPISGTIVNATPFTAEYSNNSLIALEAQDFVDAAATTCEHVRQQIITTFTTGFVTVGSVGCTVQQTSNNPLSITFDLFVAFDNIAATPATSDIDILVLTAFQQPAVQDLVADLQALDGLNPFSTTTDVVYII